MFLVWQQEFPMLFCLLDGCGGAFGWHFGGRGNELRTAARIGIKKVIVRAPDRMPQMQWHVTLCVRRKWLASLRSPWIVLGWLAGVLANGRVNEKYFTLSRCWCCFHLLWRPIVDIVSERACVCVFVTHYLHNAHTEHNNTWQRWEMNHFFAPISEMNWTVNVYEHDDGEGAKNETKWNDDNVDVDGGESQAIHSNNRKPESLFILFKKEKNERRKKTEWKQRNNVCARSRCIYCLWVDTRHSTHIGPKPES